MVLHNDKWSKKAKKAVERRKGTSHAHRRDGTQAITKPLERLDMNRPEEEDGTAEDPSNGGSGSSSEDSFIFDSGDEGNPQPVRSTQLTSNTSASGQQGPTTVSSVWQRAVPAATSSNTLEAAATSATPVSLAPPKVDKRFARRKLMDNSSRYEESVLDPYLPVDVEEPGPDYRSLRTRQFENPNQVEVVPSKTMQPGVQIMEDTAHFERMKLMQQKDEYARMLKLEFGRRSGFGKAQEQTEDDDAFFAAMQMPEAPKSNVCAAEQRNKQGESPQRAEAGTGHESLEPFLDDLLRF